jgi:hypothetical protein
VSRRHGVLVLDSITQVPAGSRGGVVIAGSHGGVYAAFLAARAGLGGVVLHDAGIGMDEAGVAGLEYLERLGCAAAAVAHSSARIGDGEDMARRGVISRVNARAAARGCVPGEVAMECALRLAGAPAAAAPPPYRESRIALRTGSGGPAVWGLDSISLAREDDERSILVSGSHGGLLGGRPSSALRVPARAAIYNDAGVGIDDAGIARLAALDLRGIPAATVGAFTARIGSARSSWETGVITHVNRTAAILGGEPGAKCQELVAAIASAQDD